MTELPRTLKIASLWLLLGTLVFLGRLHIEQQQGKMRLRAP